MKKVNKNSTENCHFYSSEKSLCIAWAFFRNDKFHASSVEHEIFFITLGPVSYMMDT